MKNAVTNLEAIITQSRNNKSLECCANIEQLAISVRSELNKALPKVEMALEMFDLIEQINTFFIDNVEIPFSVKKEVNALFLKATAVR